MTDRELVARGAAWLDVRVPGWAARIDLGRLDINSTERCVLAQVFAAEGRETARGGYEYAREFVTADVPECAAAFAGWPHGETERSWRDEIEARLARVARGSQSEPALAG